MAHKIHTIYQATNKKNGKSYVGYTSKSLEKRRSEHEKQCQGSDSSIVFYNALKKWGLKNFTWRIVYQSRDRDHTLNTMEGHFISEFNSHITEHGYNMTRGGEGASELIVAKMLDGSIKSIHISDPLWQSDELMGIAKDTVTVRDKDGNMSRVSYDDPRYLSGELIPASKGYKWYYTTEDGEVKNGTYLPGTQPFGWLLGKGFETKWYNNGTECKKFIIDQHPDGWIEGDLRKPFNNGTKVKYFIPGTEPEGWLRGDLQYLQPTRVYYNNGVIQTRCIEGNEPEGFVRGKLPKELPMKWYTNGSDSGQYVIDQQPEGWELGRFIPQEEKDKRPYNNGKVEKKFTPGTEPEGFVRGRLITDNTGGKGKKYYNNGTIKKAFVPGNEPEGWKLGEIPRKPGTKKYYNNGVEQKGFVPGTEPQGWKLGGLPKTYLHGTKWYNRGNEESKFIPGKEPEGWVLGRKDSTK